jgi:hypothetical protein
MTGTAPGRRWRSHGFGLGIDSSFPLLGCSESETLDTRPWVRLDLVSRQTLRDAIPPEGRSTIGECRAPGGRRSTHVQAHPDRGYLLSATGFGAYHITSCGERVQCAPTSVAVWRWQRYLIGQVLPFVSTLRGLEPLHASAVAIDGAAVAIVGPSGGGKSSLAAELASHGAPIVADDVLALEAGDEGLVAHPGTGLLSLRWATIHRMGRARVAQLGRRVGANAEAVRLSVPRQEAPLPLAVLYRLEAASKLREVQLVSTPAPDPRTLLGSTFNLAVRTPTRLAKQLDVCARLARTVRIVTVRIPPEADHAQVAEELLDDVLRAGTRP